MQKLPRLSGKQVVKMLCKAGFNPARQRGSHIILKKITSKKVRAVVVPNHKEIDRGTLLNIIRQSGMKKSEFLKLK